MKITALPSSRPLVLALALMAGGAFAAPAVPDPAGAHARAVSAARAGNFNRALPALEQLVRAWPKNLRYRYDLIVVRSWAGQHAEALDAARGLIPKRLPEYVLAALAHSARMAGNAPLAIDAYNELLRRKPGSADYRQGLALSNALTQAAPAPAPVAPPPPPEDPADVSAREIRAAIRATNASWRPERYAALDGALAANAIRIVKADADQATARGRRLRLDRISALVVRGQDEAALALGAQLAGEAPLPAYVQAALGDAHLHLRQPEAAAREYRAALAQEPDQIEWRQALYFAELEAEQHDAADAVIADLETRAADASEATRRETAILAARAALYANRPAQAEARIDAVLAKAPDHAGARQTAAGIAAARGQPRRAETIYRDLLVARPGDIDARIGLAEALRARGDRAGAAAIADELAASAPEHAGVARLTRDQAVLARAEFDSRIEIGRGAGSVTGNEDHDWHTYLYSAPIDGRWRVFAHHLQSASDYAGGSPRHERVGLGAEYTVRDWQTVAEAGQALDNGRDQSLSVRTAWAVDDHWSVRLGAEHNTDDLPLKGRNRDFQTLADRYSASVSYRWNESRALSLGVTRHDFNDGNTRTAFSLGFSQRLLSAPRYRLDLSADAYTSQGERVDVAYYNPRRDLALSLGLEAQITGWRRYDHSLTHVVGMTVGRYHEQAYGFGGAADPDYGWNVFHALRYGHRWQLGPALAVDYGVGVRMFPYDGQQEHRSYLYAGVNWRF